MRVSSPVLPLISIALLVFFSGQVMAEPAGEVEELSGTVEAQLGDEPSRTLSEGDKIFVDDVITTARRSQVVIRFRDQTLFELGPKSTFEVNDFTYQHETGEPSFGARIVRGTFRFVTGLVARDKPEAFNVTATVATIGIRGTHVVGEVEDTSATIILMDPVENDQVGAIEVHNEFGSVMIDQAGWGTEIPDEFSPPSPPRRMQMNTIQNITRSLQTLQRMNVPRPRMPQY
jgi:hypothetical protein